MTLNQPALTLLDFAVPRTGGELLDLRSGILLHGLAAGESCRRVVGSDLNPRARMFGAFNAALNGRSNVECVTGDLFSAVQGQCFDLVLSNPPFVLSPGNHFLFRDNPLELDGFCRQLIEQVGDDLNEGGLCRLICEWVEITGQSWQDRLAEWFDGAGCDVWVLSANRQSPSTYARDWVYETGLYSGEDLHQRYDAWLGHLVRHNVEAIHGGLIFLRRRTGANWVSFDQIEEGSDGRPLGAAAERGFAVRDFLQAHQRDADLFGARLRIVARRAPGVQGQLAVLCLAAGIDAAACRWWNAGASGAGCQCPLPDRALGAVQCFSGGDRGFRRPDWLAGGRCAARVSAKSYADCWSRAVWSLAEP